MIFGRRGDAGTSSVGLSLPLTDMRKAGMREPRMGTGEQGGWGTLDSVKGGVQSTIRPFAHGEDDGGGDKRALTASVPAEVV